MAFPQERPRRLRRTESLRRLTRETLLGTSSLVAPLFVTEAGKRREVRSMPGVFQLPCGEAVEEAGRLYEAGIQAVILFGIPSEKD